MSGLTSVPSAYLNLGKVVTLELQEAFDASTQEDPALLGAQPLSSVFLHLSVASKAVFTDCVCFGYSLLHPASFQSLGLSSPGGVT